MSLADLDALIHAPKRLAAMALLANSEAVEFAFLRDHLEVKDADLSKQMKALVEAGYVSTRKSKVGRGGKRWFRITAEGRTAFDQHVSALRSIVATADSEVLS
ncbi:MAG: transcriptional regulator [Acidimicrobiia bacterium]